MPNIRSQSIDANGITLVASDGRSITITRAQIAANFTGRTGTRTARRTATITNIGQLIVSALGAEQVSPTAITFDFDDQDSGRPTLLETR